MQTNNQTTYTLGKLQMYDERPQKYKLCYIDKVHIVEPISKTQTGTAIHNLINYYLKGMDVSKMVEALNSNEKKLWHNFKNSNISNYKFVDSEYAFNLKIDEYWLSGRIDALFEYDGDYIIPLFAVRAFVIFYIKTQDSSADIVKSTHPHFFYNFLAYHF